MAKCKNIRFHGKFRRFFSKRFNNDIGLTLSFIMARSNLLSGLLYGKSSWIL